VTKRRQGPKWSERQENAGRFLDGFGRGRHGETADGGHLRKTVAGGSDVQYVLPAAGPRLEHANQPLPHDIDARTGVVFAKNHLSLAEIAEPADRGQPPEAGRLNPGE
jgi:hypothetical protein